MTAIVPNKIHKNTNNFPVLDAPFNSILPVQLYGKMKFTKAKN